MSAPAVETMAENGASNREATCGIGNVEPYMLQNERLLGHLRETKHPSSLPCF